MDTIDFYVARLRKSQISIVSGWISQIREMLDECSDIGEFYYRSVEIYPELDVEKFSKNFERATVAASLAGIYEAQLNEIPVEFTEPDKEEYRTVSFDLAIDFFQNKINLDTDKFDDLKDGEHDQAFVSAGAKGALLQDLRLEVEDAIIRGKDREQFKQEFNEIVKRRGWDVKGGNDWRASIIYQTNLRQAYGEGRCRQMSDPDVQSKRPYRMWVHGNSAEPRPAHIAMNGKVFRADDPIANQRLPMGFGCRCTWVTLSERDLKRRGLQVTEGLSWNDLIPTIKGDQPLEIDKGFKNPCKFETEREREERKARARQAILDKLPVDIRRDAIREIAGLLGVVGVVGSVSYVGYEFLSDSVGATQALVAIYQQIADKLGIRSALPKQVDAKTAELLNDKGFRQDIATNLYQNLENLEKDIAYEAANPNYVEELKRQGVSTAEERFNYSMDLVNRQGIHEDYRYSLGKFRDSDIPPEELAALRWYTSTQGYKEMNGILRGKTDEVWEAVEKFKLFNGTKDEWLKTVENDIRMATHALNRMETFKGKVYRGLELPQELIDSLKVGGEWVEEGFMSTTKNPLQRYPGNAVFVVNSKNSGKNIIPFERYANNEILFAPNSKFKIKSKRLVKKFGQEFWLIEMDDVNPKINLLEKLNTKAAESVVNQNENSRISVDDFTPKNRPTENKTPRPPKVDLKTQNVSEPAIPLEKIPDVTRSIIPKERSIVLVPKVSEKTSQPPIKSPEIEPTPKIVPEQPKLRTPTPEELNGLRELAKRDLPFRVRINKLKDGRFNVQPTKADNYQWSPDKAQAVADFLKANGVAVGDNFDPNNPAWQEGLNYLNVSDRADLPISRQAVGNLSAPIPNKFKVAANQLNRAAEFTRGKLSSYEAERDIVLERLGDKIDEDNPLYKEVKGRYNRQIGLIKKQIDQQERRARALAIDAERLETIKAEGKNKIVTDALRDLVTAQSDLDRYKSLDQDIKLTSDLIETLTKDREGTKGADKAKITRAITGFRERIKVLEEFRDKTNSGEIRGRIIKLERLIAKELKNG